jgi:Mg-chelatase subunit ChlD
MGDLEVLCGPTPTATPTSTSGATPTPTVTSTHVPEPIYLPIAVRESCLDRTRHADVVLVLDASTSMRRHTSAGRPKSEAALEAAASFIDLLDFTPNFAGDQDQVSLVGFNASAWIQAPLTSDSAELAAALADLPSREAEGTRLDLAVERGREAVLGAGHRSQNKPLLILLTDGLPNRVPTPVGGGSEEDTVTAEAALAKSLGVTIVTIGVGDPNSPDPASRINAELLRAVASAPDLFYQTPDAEALQAIYNDAAIGVILCPRGRHRWGEPWP